MSVRLGTLDDDPGIRPGDRAFFDSRAVWDHVADDLPRWPGARGVGRAWSVRDVLEQFAATWNAGDFDAAREVLSEDSRRVDDSGTEHVGAQALASWRAEFSNGEPRTWRIEEVFTEGPRAVVLARDTRCGSCATWCVEVAEGRLSAWRAWE